MTQIHKKLVAIMLSVIMALTVFPCLGMSFAQTAFADDEITAEEVTGDDGAAAVEEEPVVEEEPAVEEEAVQKEKRVQKNDSEIYIEPFADRSVLYSDGNSKFYVYGWSDEDYNFQYQVGLGYRDDYGDWHWDKVFTAGSGLYTYNEDSEVLTLYGSAIHSEVNAYNQSHGSQYNEVFIRATFSDRYGNVYQDSSLGVDLAEPCYDFNGWLNDRMLLLDESDYVKKTFWAEVWNAKYPDGEDVKCTVSKLTSSDSAVVKLTEKEKRWNYKGVGEGIATLTATVKIGKMDPMEVPFKVEVGMDSVGGEIVLLGSEDGLPGESLPVRADAWHDAYDYDYDDCENEVFGYEWFIDENDTDYATVKADSEDPSYATVTFKNRTDKDLERDVTVCCRISYLGNNGKTVSTVCSEYVTVHTDYYEISPQDLDTLDIDQSVTIKPELQFCTVNSAGEPVRQPQSATIKWTYDKKIINREDLGGGKYKLTRIKPGEVEIELYCDYNGEEYGAYYFMEEIATNLSYYELEFVGAAEYGDTYYIDDSNEGITPEIHVIDPETDYIVPESEYDLIVQKIVYTKNGGEKYEDSSFPLKFNYDPAKLSNTQAQNLFQNTAHRQSLRRKIINLIKSLSGRSRILQKLFRTHHDESSPIHTTTSPYISSQMRNELEQLSLINYGLKGYQSMQFIDLTYETFAKSEQLFSSLCISAQHFDYSDYSYIMILPWLISGGIDLFAVNYLNTIAELHQDQHILVLLTNDAHPSFDKDALGLAPNITLIDYPKIFKNNPNYKNHLPGDMEAGHPL